MRYLKTYKQLLESTIFDSGWTDNLPTDLSIVTSTGNYTLELKRDKSLGHNVDVTNLMNCIQISYYQNTAEDGNVTKDGEPDYLCFDITLVKDNDGTERSPDTLKLNVDISYGDNMASSFSIQKPNKVTLSHYTGIGSKHDSETKFAFTDESLKSLVDFFNKFGYELTVNDFKFLDNDDNSFKYKDDPKHLYTDKISDMDLKMRNDEVDINAPINLELKK